MDHHDKLIRFSFTNLDIRGELAYLNASWRTIQECASYPPVVRRYLGEAMAAVVLLSSSLKYEGSMILQIQSKGAIRTLVAQSSNQGSIRGMASWEGDDPQGSMQELLKDGQIVITVIRANGERYQSIVPLTGDTMAFALSDYFMQSEQLNTTFQLFVDDQQVGGMMLQELPPASESTSEITKEPVDEAVTRAKQQEDRQENWNRINILADTLKPEEVMTLASEKLLLNLFHEEQVTIFEPKALYFECTCSEEKVTNTLVNLGKQELIKLLAEGNSISVDCEFCNKHYEYGPKEVDALFPDTADEARVVH